MSSVKTIDLGLKGYDELFMTGKERLENNLPKIYDIPLSEIDDFPDHPYKVKLDEDMDQLVQSIKERGVLTAITLRTKEDGRYRGFRFETWRGAAWRWKYDDQGLDRLLDGSL